MTFLDLPKLFRTVEDSLLILRPNNTTNIPAAVKWKIVKIKVVGSHALGLLTQSVRSCIVVSRRGPWAWGLSCQKYVSGFCKIILLMSISVEAFYLIRFRSWSPCTWRRRNWFYRQTTRKSLNHHLARTLERSMSYFLLKMIWISSKSTSGLLWIFGSLYFLFFFSYIEDTRMA